MKTHWRCWFGHRLPVATAVGHEAACARCGRDFVVIARLDFSSHSGPNWTDLAYPTYELLWAPKTSEGG